MPAMYPCENYAYCGKFVDAHDKKRLPREARGLCSECRTIARQNERDERIEREYKRLTTKPNKPTFQEIEREVK